MEYEQTDSVIQVRGLRRMYGMKAALDGLSLDVPRGVVFGLVGENGAGKTTLIRHILGLLRAKEGIVSVFGLDPVRHPVEVLVRIGYLSEDRDLPDWMRVGELMRYTQAFYPDWDESYAEQLRETFELTADVRVKSLSRGERARAGLLVALAHRPDLLLLDEPSSGLDPIVRRDILSAIIRTVADEGRTVVFSSHLLEEVERVADIVAMIHEGRLVMCDRLDAIKEGHHQLTLRFDDLTTAETSVPGALAGSWVGHELTVVCVGAREASVAAAQGQGLTIVDERTPTLDEIFVAHIKAAANERKRGLLI